MLPETTDSRRFKKPRLGPLLLRRAADPAFFQQTHVIFGGTGAVGGATAIQIISLFEEALALQGRPEQGRPEPGRPEPGRPEQGRPEQGRPEPGRPEPGRPEQGRPEPGGPRIVITGRTRSEIRQFTRLLFDIHQREHGQGCLPERIEKIGYRTVAGVLVELTTFGVDPVIPGLETFAQLDTAGRKGVIQDMLRQEGIGGEATAVEKIRCLEGILEQRVGRPFSEFLEGLSDEHNLSQGRSKGDRRFRSVTVGIPLASIAAYRLPDLEAAAILMGAEPGSPDIEQLKDRYLVALRDDLANIRTHLADEVLAAHTTAVGGMYDEEQDGSRTIRLGFAHSALDEKLRDKQSFAEKLVHLYSECDIKMLVTAAAIGVDSILVRHSPPMNRAIRRLLLESDAAGHPAIPKPDVGARLRVYPPHDLDLLDEAHEAIALQGGRPLVLDYLLRSGENGYFTVSNTDALYRVMRVTSASELGLLLARTAIFGDDEGSPFFTNSSCYYTESDYSRQVFDLLTQPKLLRSQISGLQPKALQDLGSAKHQAELHTLGLLILLHRLETLDLEPIPAHVDLSTFNPRYYFESHSRVLTLENTMVWRPESLAGKLRTLVTARDEDDLRPLKSFFQADPERQQAAHRVLLSVLHAAWAVSSIGTPILYEAGGRRRIAAGYYAASLDHLITYRDSFAARLRDRFEEIGGGSEDHFEHFVEFHIANNGFADLRPIAVLVSARSDEDDLQEKVQVFRSESDFVSALKKLPPYSYFTTSGLIALTVRLRGLCKAARELDLTLGTANEFRAHIPHDHRDRPLLVPGVIEAFRMVSEGLEKNTGLERLDGRWGYDL